MSSVTSSRSSFSPLSRWRGSWAYRRALLLGSTALVGAGLVLSWAPNARASCAINGESIIVVGDINLNQGQELVCDDIDLTDPIEALEDNVNVTLGNGVGDADTTLTLDASVNRDAITVLSDSTVTLNADSAITTEKDSDGSVVSTLGSSDGVQVTGDDSVVSITGGSITVGNSGVVLNGDRNSAIMDSGIVNAEEAGLFASGGGNTITISGGTVEGAATNGGAIFTQNGDNAVTVSGGAVSAAGRFGAGVYVLDGNNTVTLSGGTVSASGEYGKAVKIFVGDATVDTLYFGTGANVDGDLFVNKFEAEATIPNTGIANLVLNGEGAQVFNDDITGFETITKKDNGSFDLGGAISEVDTIQISAGLLAINGDASGTAVAVNDGGTLGGTGTLGTTVVNTGARLAAGNSIGTLRVDDNLTIESGSVVEVEVDDAGNVDLISVENDVQINGGAVQVLPEWTGQGAGVLFLPGESFTFLTAGGTITGTFDEIDVIEDFAFLDAGLEVNPAEVNIVYLRNDVAFADLADTDNGKAAADAVESAGEGNDLFNAVVGLSEDVARDLLDQLPGEVHASTQGVLVQEGAGAGNRVNSQLRTILEADATPAAAVSTYGAAADDTGFGLTGWSDAYGAIMSLDGDGNASSVDAHSGGFLAGVGKTIGYGVHAGVFGGYARSHVSIDDAASDADADIYTFGAYAGRQMDRIRAQVGAAYSLNVIETDRQVHAGSLNETLTTDYNAHTLQAFGELAYRFDTAFAAFEPFAGLAHVAVISDGYTETGGITALTSDSQTQNVTYTNLGLRVRHDFKVGPAKGRLHGLAGWQHAFGDTSAALDQAFAAGGDPFTAVGTPIAQDALLVEAGMDLDLTKMATFGLGYNGRLGEGDEQHSFSGRFRLRY